MPTLARQFFLATLVLLLGQRAAIAHSSLESTLSFWVRPAGIDVQIYMSRGSAAVLLEKDGEHVTIMRENFSMFQNRLAANGPALLSLKADDGTALMADTSTLSITDEDDICYRLHYPLPKVLPGTLTIRGSYLNKMDDGHVGSIYVLNATNDSLGQGEVRAESPDFQVHLPAVSTTLGKTYSAADTVPTASTNESPRAIRWGLWALLGGGILVIAGVAWRGIARQNVDRKPSS